MNACIVKMMLIATLIGIVLPIHSQTPDDLKITSERIVRAENQISVSMNFILDEMNIKSNDMVILTPTLKSNETNGELLSLPPIVVTGKLRGKIVARMLKLGNHDQLPFQDEPQTILRRKNNTPQSVDYTTSVPYQEWMSNASLRIEKVVSGCANCSSDAGDQLIVQNILPKPEPASFQLTYITPKPEPVEARTDRHTVSFNYPVDSYELLRDYKNNSAEFAQIDKIIEEIKNNEKLEITEFTVAGYASPEGRFEYNQRLSKNRANSLAYYLVEKLGISPEKISIEGKGENWAELYNAVSNSNLADKSEILNIIDNVQDPDARDRLLKKLSNGSTYKTLLKEYYPQLRRTEYTIAYKVRSLDEEEVKQIVKTNPEQLSLNEMYMAAASYPSESEESKDVLKVVAQLYPDNEIVIVNSAASAIESGNYDDAIERLEKIEDNPIAWNNLGVAYALKNNIKKASEYFKKALNNAEAEANLRIIQRTDPSD